MRAASWPVKATVAVELAAAGLVLVVAWGQLGPRVGGLVDVDALPPWRLLAIFPVTGLAAALLHAWRPDEALRRWHGVALRRVDEWFA
jgi:hypothetical protein